MLGGWLRRRAIARHRLLVDECSARATRIQEFQRTALRAGLISDIRAWEALMAGMDEVIERSRIAHAHMDRGVAVTSEMLAYFLTGQRLMRRYQAEHDRGREAARRLLGK